MSKLYAKRPIDGPVDSPYTGGRNSDFIETAFTEEQFDRLVKDRDRLLVALARIKSNNPDGYDTRMVLETTLAGRDDEVAAARSRLPNSGEPDRRG